MKISKTKGEGSLKKTPLLPLVPDPEAELNSSNSVSYLLKDSPTFKKYVRVLNGSEGVQSVLTWSSDQAQVIRGLVNKTTSHVTS